MNWYSIFLSSLFLLARRSVVADEENYASSSSLRRRNDREPTTTTKENECIDSSLPVGKLIRAGEAICNNEVQFGVFAYDEGSTKTEYRLELRREGRLIKFLDAIITTDGTAPFVALQHDGHLLFGANRGFSQCVVGPGRDSSKNRLRLIVAGDEIELEIKDREGEVVWRYDTIDGESSCHPDLKETCYSALKKNDRITWKEYLCLYDNHGQVKYKYGLDETGLLGLWQYDRLIYRPKGGMLRGDYFHIQDDGHLTLYKLGRGNRPKKYVWTSDNCIDDTVTKLVLTSDGDVQELNEQGAIVWTLLGSQWDETFNGYDARDTVTELCHPSQIMSN